MTVTAAEVHEQEAGPVSISNVGRRPPFWRGATVPAVLALVSGAVLWTSRTPRETFGPSSSDIIAAGAVPIALFTVLGVLCVAQLGASVVGRSSPPADASTVDPPNRRRVVVFCLWFATCVALTRAMLSIDLTLSVAVFVTGWAFLAGLRSRVGLLVVAGASATIVNVLVYFTNSPVASLL